MTNIGHKARAAQVAEQVKRRQREVVKHVNERETLAQSWIERLERVEKMLAEFENSAAFTLPKAYQEIIERLEALENSAPTEPAELKDEIDKLNAKIADIAKAALGDLLEHSERLDSMDTRLKNMPGRLRKFFADEFERIA